MVVLQQKKLRCGKTKGSFFQSEFTEFTVNISVGREIETVGVDVYRKLHCSLRSFIVSAILLAVFSSCSTIP